MRAVSKYLALGTVVLTAGLAAQSAIAQSKIELTYSDTVAETDIRAKTLKTEFGDCLGDEFDFKPYHSATLFKQGTELTAMQRGNLDMALFRLQSHAQSVGFRRPR